MSKKRTTTQDEDDTKVTIMTGGKSTETTLGAINECADSMGRESGRVPIRSDTVKVKTVSEVIKNNKDGETVIIHKAVLKSATDDPTNTTQVVITGNVARDLTPGDEYSVVVKRANDDITRY